MSGVEVYYSKVTLNRKFDVCVFTVISLLSCFAYGVCTWLILSCFICTCQQSSNTSLTLGLVKIQPTFGKINIFKGHF